MNPGYCMVLFIIIGMVSINMTEYVYPSMNLAATGMIYWFVKAGKAYQKQSNVSGY